MRVPSSARRTGARKKPVHFEYVQTERGQPWEAYLAGPIWWGYLHMTKPSKPCVAEVTGGALVCPFCRKPPRPVAVMKGWVPLYRRADSHACMVPVDEVQRDDLDALPPFTKVAVGRERGKGAQVWVRKCNVQDPAFSCTLPEKQVPADVTESLLTVWAMPEVTAFFSMSSDNALSLDIERGEERERAKEAGGQAPAVRPYVAPDPTDANKAFVDSVNRAKDRMSVYDPSKNGKK
jgi:hypothetical protein